MPHKTFFKSTNAEVMQQQTFSNVLHAEMVQLSNPSFPTAIYLCLHKHYTFVRVLHAEMMQSGFNNILQDPVKIYLLDGNDWNLSVKKFRKTN